MRSNACKICSKNKNCSNRQIEWILRGSKSQGAFLEKTGYYIAKISNYSRLSVSNKTDSIIEKNHLNITLICNKASLDKVNSTPDSLINFHQTLQKDADFQIMPHSILLIVGQLDNTEWRKKVEKIDVNSDISKVQNHT